MLYIERWDEKRRYDTLCKVTAMDAFLIRSALVRDIFGMDPPVCIEDADPLVARKGKVKVRMERDLIVFYLKYWDFLIEVA